MNSAVWNLIGIGGAALVVLGAWLAYPPAGVVIGGAVLLVAAVFLSPRGET